MFPQLPSWSITQTWFLIIFGQITPPVIHSLKGLHRTCRSYACELRAAMEVRSPNGDMRPRYDWRLSFTIDPLMYLQACNSALSGPVLTVPCIHHNLTFITFKAAASLPFTFHYYYLLSLFICSNTKRSTLFRATCKFGE